MSQKRESMYIQNVPKVGISSVVHSKHIDSGNIDVVDNDIALFDTESVISLYNGPTTGGVDGRSLPGRYWYF